MKTLRGCGLFLCLLLLGESARPQWGNSRHEKADVLGRDLSWTALWADVHDGIFWEYTTGNPDDANNSILIEMLGGLDDAILTKSVQSFTDASLFRGSFGMRNMILTRVQRAQIIQTIRGMENRTPTPIGYVSYPIFNQYLDWSNRDGNSQLDLDDIDNMRSDAVVEFAYTVRGFPIVGNSLVRTTIQASPNLFRTLASLTSVANKMGLLLPSSQLYRMDPATIDFPDLTVYDANGTILEPGSASSMTAITATVTDLYSGPGRLEIWLGPVQAGTLIAVNNDDWDSITHTYKSTDSGLSGMGSLADGHYTLRAIDQAGNVSNSDFVIDTNVPEASKQSAGGGVLGSTVTSMKCVVPMGTSPTSGIASIAISGPPGFGAFTFPFSCSQTGKIGPYCQIPTGNYTITVTNCAGLSDTDAFYYDNSSAINYIFEATGSSFGVKTTSGTFSLGKLRADPMTINSRGGSSCLQVAPLPGNCGPTPNGIVSGYSITPSASSNLTITNSTNAPVTSGIAAELWLHAESIYAEVASLEFPYSPTTPFVLNDSIAMTATIAEVGQIYPTSSGTVSASPPFAGPAVASPSAACNPHLELASRQLLGISGECASYFSSDFIFVSSAPIRFQYTDAAVDTTTLRIYGWTGLSWSSGAVANQTTSRSASNLVVAAGDTGYSGYYAALYRAQDSSAPVTTFAIQGASFNFDGALFVSTDAYVVLTATDPAVNGFSSTVASVTYRLDPSIDSPFSIYSSSIPLSLGTHLFEYRSLDYAGNVEATKTSTFTVTAGTAFRASSTARVPGVLLNGFLGSGAKLEIESQAQNSLTLLISSANRQGMVAVDNIGEVGIGVTPQANLNVGVSSIAVQLRAGNSTSAVTSNQIAFGFNGDYSMRHLLRTEHSTAAHGNKLDFLVWNTGAASTTTLASLNVLSLQGIASAGGGSFHVQPVGEPDAEVEVSNGLSTGGGTLQRLQWVLPSSRRFKTDIKELSAKDEDRALADVAGLKHARFRYKSRGRDGRLVEDPAQPLRTGLIYEEAPDSVRDGKDALSTGDRLVNVELALKASIRRLEELQARYERLKARRKP